MTVVKAGSLGSMAGISLSLLILAGILSAQAKTANLSGWVTDIYNDILPEVNITLSGPQITPLTTKTGPTGMYLFKEVPPGIEYTITAELAGYRKVSKTGIVVQAGSRNEIELTLEHLIVSKWHAAKTAFLRFMEEPSPSTSREFYSAISNGQGIDDKTGILDYIFGRFTEMGSVGRYGIIAAEMLNGDLNAARSAIRLLGFIDKGWQKPQGGAFFVSMRVGASLGKLIRVNPFLFLRACYEERFDPFLQEKGFPVNYIPFILHMKKAMVSYEMEMRREALRSVDDPELQVIRDLCMDTIEKGTQLFEAFATERPRPGEPEGRRLSESEETVKKVLLEMANRPSPENMKKVLALFDERGGGFDYLIIDIFPGIVSSDEGWPPRLSSGNNALEIILHEAACGNENALDVAFSALFYAYRYWDDLAIQSIQGVISNLILARPTLFIEKAAQYRCLDGERPDYPPGSMRPTILALICGDIDIHSYPILSNVILKRRIDALAALNMPQHINMIDRCIRLIEERLR